LGASEDTHLVGDPAVENQKGGDESSKELKKEKSKDKKDKSGDSLTAGRLSIFRRSRRQSQPPVAEKEDDPEVELEEPSLEMLESWMEANTGFDALMSCPKGRQLFKQFLVREFSRENLDFWDACNSLNGVKNDKMFREKVEHIFVNFIETSAENEVSLDFRVKEKLLVERDTPSRDMFMEAQAKIYTLMHRDSFPRFLSSPVFKDLLESKQNERKGNVAGDEPTTEKTGDTNPPTKMRKSLTDSIRLSLGDKTVVPTIFRYSKESKPDENPRAKSAEESLMKLLVPADDVESHDDDLEAGKLRVKRDEVIRIDSEERRFHSMINKL